MARREPFVLLDDARVQGASDAHLYTDARTIFVARRPDEAAAVLQAADAARLESVGTLAGYIAYEAGFGLEPRLAPLAEARSGASGPLVWLGLFDKAERIPASEIPQWLAGQAPGPASIGPLEPQIALGDYAQAFTALQDAICAGDIYQANLTFPLAGSYRGDPLALYAAIRPAAAAGYGGVIFDGSHWLLSFSPELFFSLKNASSGAGAAKVKPMKGTRPRGRDTAEDSRLAADLAASAKDRAENLMIVDLMRNDLSRVARAGSVRVDQPFAIESYPTVHQMVSTVRATLLPGKGAIDMIDALFPCGSITGAPKIRAMELIGEIERDARGPYCGAIGRIDGTGDAAFNVAIRTLRLTPEENGAPGENKQGRAVLGVGSAIVADSQMLPEWRECLLKGSFVRQSLSAQSMSSGASPEKAAAGFDLIETMAFDPGIGILLLDLHLERMNTSASELGFAFDRHAARNQIQALCFEIDEPSKLRLVLARSGATTLEVSPLSLALAEPPNGPVRCAILPLPVDASDWRLRHKSSDRGFYEAALRVARKAGAGEALFLRDDWLVTEGCFTNIFVESGGKLLTPPQRLGLLPGVLRRSLLESGRAEEAELRIDDLADGFLIGNALRGLMKAKLLP